MFPAFFFLVFNLGDYGLELQIIAIFLKTDKKKDLLYRNFDTQIGMFIYAHNASGVGDPTALITA